MTLSSDRAARPRGRAVLLPFCPTRAAAGLLPPRKTVQNDDFGAPRGAPSGRGRKTA
ncbi:hypothetical protein HDG42_001517 [Paraburkholderia sp. JPY171]|nr:hypothetical protein [Paraburkholderia atlantica]